MLRNGAGLNYIACGELGGAANRSEMGIMHAMLSNDGGSWGKNDLSSKSVLAEQFLHCKNTALLNSLSRAPGHSVCVMTPMRTCMLPACLSSP